jgi:2-polyprenyl-6-methoxyphenol hydroxylase-like FAD-dependent oxidoreductase
MRIAVIGAGISGLSFAVGCLMQGIKVSVFEREPGIKPIGAGIVLHPNGMSALAALGCEQPLMDRAEILNEIVLHKREGVLNIDLRKVWEDSPHPSIAVTRSALHSLLHAKLDGGTIGFGREVTGVQHAEGGVQLVFADGSIHESDIVVACDGVHSQVRALLLDEKPSPLGIWYWRYCTNAPLGAAGEWHTYEGQDGLNTGFFPVGEGASHCFIQMLSDQPPFETSADATDWLEQRRANLGWVDESLGARTTPIHFGPAYERAAHRWFVGRVAFLGDSSHAMSPTASEGASFAVEDAVVLSGLLGARSGATSVAEILERYRDSRAARLEMAQRVGRQQVRSLKTIQSGDRPLMSAQQIQQFMRMTYKPFANGF